MKSAAIVLTILALALLTGCLADRWVEVAPGQYIVVQRSGAANTIALAEIRLLEIDRDKRRVRFTRVDGSERVIPFGPRDRAAWPAGCPSNINSTRMEVLDLEADRLTLGSMTLNQPLLVRACPPDPMQVVLREDGPIGGGGAACTDVDRCVFFERR